MSKFYTHIPAERKTVGHTLQFDLDRTAGWPIEPVAVLPIIATHFGLDPTDAARAAVELAEVSMAAAWGAA